MADHQTSLIQEAIDIIRRRSHAIADHVRREFITYASGSRRIRNDIHELNRFFRYLISEYHYDTLKADAYLSLTSCPTRKEWLSNFRRYVLPLLLSE